MEDLSATRAELPSPELTAPGRRRRPFCDGCRRAASVCLCALIPSPPITTATKIVILQHPHECRHRLATVPLLSACISAVNTVVGRRLRPGLSPLLDSIAAAANTSPLPLYLFPPTFHSPSLPLSRLPSSSSPSSILILFDATWNHAAEMVAASLPFLHSISAVRVSLDAGGGGGGGGGSIYDSELILRKEPKRGYVSTMEAVAEAMAVLEPDGILIRCRLLEVLKAMVRFQASHLEKKNLKPGNRN